jgi:hypothetical protein
MRAMALSERYAEMSGRLCDLTRQTQMEGLLLSWKACDIISYLEKIGVKERRYFMGSVYKPLMAMALMKRGKTMDLNEQVPRRRYWLIDVFLGGMWKNTQIPSVTALAFGATMKELYCLTEVGKIYGRKNASWLRRVLFYNRALGTLDWLASNPQKAEAFPGESILPAASMKGLPKVQKLQDIWRHRLYKKKDQFREIITYGRAYP